MVRSNLSQVKKTPKQSLFSQTPGLQVQNPEKEFHRVDDLLLSLGPSYILFLSLLHHKSQYLDEISYSVKTLTKFMGVGERQVQRIIKRLAELNLIHITRRYHQTNILSLSWIFECEEYKTALSIYFPNDVWYKKALFSRAQDVTLVIVEYYSKSDFNSGGDFDIPCWVRNEVRGVPEGVVSSGKELAGGPKVIPKPCSLYSFSNSEGVPRTSRSRESSMSMISNVNNEVGNAVGATEYGKLLLSAFPDHVIADAFASYKSQQKEVTNAIPWLYASARNICKKRGIQPLYDAMVQEVHVKGYGPGDDMIIPRDKEAQFRYDDPPIEAYKPHTIQAKKPIDPNNRFAKLFPVPESIRANDKQG